MRRVCVCEICSPKLRTNPTCSCSYYFCLSNKHGSISQDKVVTEDEYLHISLHVTVTKCINVKTTHSCNDDFFFFVSTHTSTQASVFNLK